MGAPRGPIEDRAGSGAQRAVCCLRIVMGSFNLVQAAVSVLWSDPAWFGRYCRPAKDFD